MSESSVLGFEVLAGLGRVSDFEDELRACAGIKQKILIALAWKVGGRGPDAKQVPCEGLSLFFRISWDYFSMAGHSWDGCVGETLTWAGAPNEIQVAVLILQDARVLENVRSWAGRSLLRKRQGGLKNAFPRECRVGNAHLPVPWPGDGS